MQQKTATISSAKIATGVGDDGAAIKRLFGSVVAKWRAAGIKAVGVISKAHGLPDRTCSAGVLRNIVSGKPVLTSVSAKHRDAWRALAPETTFLSANDATIMMWWQSLRTT